ncbi:MAG: hypothetical protein JNM25_19415 [Planctomycetes bacterium]|nr:hypothetical protein [Planctomycetota bacterium]
MNRRLLTVATALFASLLLPAQEGKTAPVDFQQQIWPILEKRCVECHTTAHTGPDGKLKKPKGGVVLDSRDGITTSKRGKLVVAKKSASSLIVESISLPADDEDRMPPAKKGDPLTKEQIALITKWIDDGADFGSWTGKAKEKEKEKEKDGAEKSGTDKSKEKGGKRDAGKDKRVGRAEVLLRLQQGVQPLPAATLAAFADGAFTVQSIGDGSPLLGVTCAGRGDEVDDQAVLALEPLREHIAELDLGRSRVGDEAGKLLAQMPRLVALDLRQTQVGNHGVAALAACTELRSLNLFGTRTGDYALAALAKLRHLEDLYVWQTDVSAAAVVRLRESLPDVRVVLAADLPEPMAEGTTPARRRR